MSEALMKKRQAAIDEAYEAQWDGGRGSHHPDYDPQAKGPNVVKATRETEELLNAIIKARRRRGARRASTVAALSGCVRARACSRPCALSRHRTTSALCTRRLRRAPT